jgi:hypothetical protein
MWVLVETLVPNRGVKDVDDHSGGGGNVHPALFGRNLSSEQ